MPGFGIAEMIVIGVIAVLLFGKKLPDVARSVGKSYNEFRKSLREIQTEVQSATDAYTSDDSDSSSSPGFNDDFDDREQATAPKFEPPAAEPAELSESSEQPSV